MDYHYGYAIYTDTNFKWLKTLLFVVVMLVFYLYLYLHINVNTSIEDSQKLKHESFSMYKFSILQLSYL